MIVETITSETVESQEDVPESERYNAVVWRTTTTVTTTVTTKISRVLAPRKGGMQ
jgi:hypothetical protein